MHRTDSDTWATKAERDNRGRPLTQLAYQPEPGIRVGPLCWEDTPPTRGSVRAGWRLLQGIVEPDNDTLHELIAGGVEVLGLHGGAIQSARQLVEALRGINLEEVGLAYTRGSVGVAAATVAAWRYIGASDARVRVFFGLDPIGLLAATGLLPASIEARLEAGAELAQWTSTHAPRSTTYTIDDSVWHSAGADEAWCIALSCANAVTHLRAMEEAGLAPQDAFDQIRLRQAIPGRFFLGITKLRATRRLSARIAALWGATGSWPQGAYAATRERTQRDPAVNILRNTASAFGGIIGGADTVELLPHHRDDVPGRRLARNTQRVLREEAQLDRVADPTGGAYALEELTEQIAQRAWAHFQQIEAKGGLYEALQSGWVYETIQSCRARIEAEVRTRKRGIIGVSRFADLTEPRPVPEMEWEPPTLLPRGCPEVACFEDLLSHAKKQPVPALNRARLGRSIARLSHPLPAVRLAEPFEQLRDRADRQPTTVFLATLGPLAEHTARSSFGREFLEAGGLQVYVSEQISTPDEILNVWHEKRSAVVVISSMPNRFAELHATVRTLTAEGVAVWCLGAHREHAEELSASGARGFIFSGVDAITMLREIWESTCPR